MKKNIFSLVTPLLLVAVSVSSGYWYAQSNNAISNNAISNNATGETGPVNPFPSETVLRADTAANGKKIAMATASIDGDVDIVFTLDYESGNLFAWLPGPNGIFLGQWAANVQAAIGLDKGADPDLVLTVGDFNVRGGNNGNLKNAPLICYVANGENGRVVGYAFQWNPQFANKGTYQSGPLVAVYTGSTREQAIKRQ